MLIIASDASASESVALSPRWSDNNGGDEHMHLASRAVCRCASAGNLIITLRFVESRVIIRCGHNVPLRRHLHSCFWRNVRVLNGKVMPHRTWIGVRIEGV